MEDYIWLDCSWIGVNDNKHLYISFSVRILAGLLPPLLVVIVIMAWIFVPWLMKSASYNHGQSGCNHYIVWIFVHWSTKAHSLFPLCRPHGWCSLLFLVLAQVGEARQIRCGRETNQWDFAGFLAPRHERRLGFSSRKRFLPILLSLSLSSRLISCHVSKILFHKHGKPTARNPCPRILEAQPSALLVPTSDSSPSPAWTLHALFISHEYSYWLHAFSWVQGLPEVSLSPSWMSFGAMYVQRGLTPAGDSMLLVLQGKLHAARTWRHCCRKAAGVEGHCQRWVQTGLASTSTGPAKQC